MLAVALDSASAMGLHSMRGYALRNLGRAELCDGRIGEARGLFDHALDVGRTEDSRRIEGAARDLRPSGHRVLPASDAPRTSRTPVSVMHFQNGRRAANVDPWTC